MVILSIARAINLFKNVFISLKKHYNLSTENAPSAIASPFIMYLNWCQAFAYTEVIYLFKPVHGGHDI